MSKERALTNAYEVITTLANRVIGGEAYQWAFQSDSSAGVNPVTRFPRAALMGGLEFLFPLTTRALRNQVDNPPSPFTLDYRQGQITGCFCLDWGNYLFSAVALYAGVEPDKVMAIKAGLNTASHLVYDRYIN